ncbi:MAG: hypothetical protein U9O94_00550 [Nanoarchaeota archaeon]|nr:hypothetical protein [Nanoarchaeota archaeon]
MKIWTLLAVFVFLMPFVLAEVECNEVLVANFNYDNGVLSYKEKITKCGYTPDRNLQPEDGYRADLLSIDNEVLHSFKFDIPLKVNVDFSDPLLKTLAGGLIILNETDFALIFPYFDDAKSIVIYNPRGYEVLSAPLIEEQFMEQKSLLWLLLLLLLLLVVGYSIYRYYKNKQSV